MTEIWNYGLHLIKQGIVHLSPVAWQLTLLIVVLLFRKQLKSLINNLREAKGFGVEIITRDVAGAQLADEFSRNISHFMSGTQGEAGASLEINSSLAENYYFFGHDLMLCYCALITGADADVISHTLQSAIAHIEKFGKGRPYDLTLKKLLADSKQRNASDWTEKLRQVESIKVWRIAREVGDIIQKESRNKPS